MSWFKEQWADVRGNAKWDIFKWAGLLVLGALAGIGYAVRDWFLSLSLPVQVLSVLLILALASCTALAFFLRRALSQPRVTIRDAEGRKVTPEFLLPREIQRPQAVAAPSSTQPIERLVLVINETPGPEAGILLRLKNTGLEVFTDCSLTLVLFAKFHEELHEFRKPTFVPLRMFTEAKLEPEHVSTDKWLVRLRNQPGTLAIPSGDHREYCETREGALWKAVLKIQAGAASYEHNLYVEWEPGSNPVLLAPPLGAP